MNVKTVNVIF